MTDEVKKKYLNQLIKDKKLIILISLAVAAVLMLVFSNTDKKSEATQSTAQQDTEFIVTENDTANELELRLKSIIGKLGVSNVDVMVMLDSSGENVYAVNSKTENNGTKNTLDSEVVMYESENGNSDGLIVSVKSPNITGVAVVCDGAESAVVRAEITKLVTNLFGIGADRVYVGSNAS